MIPLSLSTILTRFTGPMLVALLAPLAVNYRWSSPVWDELYFLHRAVCVNRSVFALDFEQADQCLSAMSKSPIMSLLLVPAGPLRDGIAALGIAPFVLALLIFSQIILLAWMSSRAGIPPLATLIAAAATSLAPSLTGQPPPFMVDDLFAVTVLNCLLLLTLEWHDPASTTGTAAVRGLLWGWLGILGVVTKLTFFYFAGLVFPALLLISWRRSSLHGTLTKTGTAALVMLLPLLIFLRYVNGYLAHAYEASFGPISAFWDDGLSRSAFLGHLARTTGLPYGLSLFGLLAWALVSSRLEQHRPRLLLAAYQVLVLCGYLYIASGSQNKDARFFWPILLAAPFCIDTAIAASRGSAQHFPLLAPTLVALALSLPVIQRLDLRAVREAEAALRALPGSDHPTTVLLATDDSAFNVETVQLARQANYATLGHLNLDTLVYDLVNGKSLDYSLNRLNAADYVIFRPPKPDDPLVPEWANRFQRPFLETLQRKGHLLATIPGEPATLIYTMH